MAVYKCKMCGGSLEVLNGSTVCECEYCGSRQTTPTNSDDSIRALYNRANTLRMKSDFDKAGELFEKILQLNDSEAEAYWGLILCKYGVEYVEDPNTLKRIPTCHRTSFDAITADEDYKNALRCGSVSQQMLYQAEAKTIDEIQKGILSISKKEQPYDVFICYKETDEVGRRTLDSVIANDIYYQLTQEGFRVFYAAITLEDKLGSEYEPYIFSALNSAKVMLVIGTKPEYFNAVWVKNEWSRYLQVMKKDRSKLLIPCFRDMDAYELPEDFAHLQAQDMAKIGFITDIVRGIRKLIAKDAPKAEAPAASPVSGSISAYLKRAAMFLEDGNWDKADQFCEDVLNIDPENAQAYLYKLMVNLKVNTTDQLEACSNPFDGNANYKKAMRFGDEKIQTFLRSALEKICQRNELQRKNKIYMDASRALSNAKTEQDFRNAASIFKTIPGWDDADEKAAAALEKANDARKAANAARCARVYQKACSLAEKDDSVSLREAIELFQSIPFWEDADSRMEECERKLTVVLEREEQEERERQRIADLRNAYEEKCTSLKNKHRQLTQRLKQATAKLENEEKTQSDNVVLVTGIMLSVFGIVSILAGGFWLAPALLLGLVLIYADVDNKKLINSEKEKARQTLTQEIASIQAELKEIAAIPSFEEFEKANGNMDLK